MHLWFCLYIFLLSKLYRKVKKRQEFVLYMDEKEFKKLIKKDRYQVFLFRTPLSQPLTWSKHCYFVVNDKGKIKRYEVIYWINKKTKRYLYVNYLPSWIGFEKSWKGYLGLIGIRHPVKLKDRFRSDLVLFIEGSRDSVAEKMIRFIEKTPKTYPFTKKYLFFPGPNSNTFIQWIINRFPESGFKLPWNAFGKGYAKRIS